MREAHPYQRLRETLLPAADRAMRSIPTGWVPGRSGALYAAYTLSEAEHTLTADADPVTVAEALGAAGFEPGHLAALKYHPDDGRTDDGNLIKRESRFAMWQLHVHLFETDDGRTELHAHHERSAWRAPRRHYAGDGYDIAEGRERLTRLVRRLREFPDYERVRPE